MKKFKDTIFTMKGFSRAAIENHLKLYEGYVNKLQEIEEKLKKVDPTSANQTFSDLRALKVELSFALGGVKNHEIYFDHLGGAGGQPKGLMKEILAKNFGSFENWFNYLGDAQNTFPIWDGSVALALDTAAYIDAFLVNLDWETIEKNVESWGLQNE